MRSLFALLLSLFCCAAALPAQRPRSADEALRRLAEVHDDEERLRHRPVRDLAAFDGDAVTRALLDELARATSLSYRRTVVRALGRKPRDGATGPLLAVLRGADNPRLCDAAAEALRRQEGPGVEALATELPRARDDRDRRNAICYALGRVASGDAARDALLAELRRAGGRDRLPPLRGLAARSGDPTVDAARLQLAGDRDTLVAATALAQLAGAGHERAAELALALARRLPADAAGDLHEAVLDGLLAAGADAPRDELFTSAAAATAPFAEHRAARWRALATPDLCRWIGETGAANKRVAVRVACARALAFAVAGDELAAALAALLGDRDPAVVRAAAATTAGAQGLDRTALLGAALTRSKAVPALLAGAVAHAATDPAMRERVQVLAGHRAPDVRATALRVLAADVPDDARAAMAALAGDNLAHRDWRVRAAAIELCRRSRAEAAPPLLIARVDAERARLAQDVRDALRDLTGQSFPDEAAWRAWWQREGERFTPRPADAGRPGRDGADATGATYWDLPVTSDRIAFVVDVSGSMAEPFGTGDGTRLDEAKRQLRAVFDRLPKTAEVDVVAFAADADAMFGRLDKLGRSKRKAADAFVAGLAAKGPTDVHEALQLAFADDEVDTIYLLTDGRPSVGAITAVDALADEVARWNVARGLRIHTIAIGERSPLLERLAEDSGGEHTVAR